MLPPNFASHITIPRIKLVDIPVLASVKMPEIRVAIIVTEDNINPSIAASCHLFWDSIYVNYIIIMCTAKIEIIGKILYLCTLILYIGSIVESYWIEI